ncbi:MAG: stalk domain-containing protein [Bacillota bacterium]|nr:stalk domain-containing protein [Bacillota bacterium]
MKKHSKLTLVALVMVVTSIVAFSTVWGYSAIRKIEATANDNIKVYYDDQLKSFTETDGSKISPVIINGRTYLPLRAVADLVGLGVEWDSASQSVKLSSNNSGVPYKDNSPVVTNSQAPASTQPANNTPAPVSAQPSSNTSASTSNNSATLTDPVKLGETYSWSASEDYLGSKASANYSFVVKKVEPITASDISKLGFKTSSDSNKFDYVMITAEQSVSNAKLASGEAYLNLAFYREIWGSKTPSGDSVIGGTDFGFTDSLKDSSEEVTKDSNGFLKKIKPGDVENFKYEGKIILPLTKGQENFLVLEKDQSLSYENKFIYFRLK